MAERVWSEKDLVRRANPAPGRVAHAEEVSGNVAATCRYYGISRNVFYRWKRRYEDEGLEGLKDRSSAPLYCPTVTHPDVVEKIIHLRQRCPRQDSNLRHRLSLFLASCRSLRATRRAWVGRGGPDV
jgi:transposase-like protein